MKASNILPLLALALPLGSAARALPGSATRVLPRHPQLQLPRADCETSDFICTSLSLSFFVYTADDIVHTACIVSLAELPLQITTCLETVNDVNDLFTQINSGSTDPSNDASNYLLPLICQTGNIIEF